MYKRKPIGVAGKYSRQAFTLLKEHKRTATGERNTEYDKMRRRHALRLARLFASENMCLHASACAMHAHEIREITGDEWEAIKSLVQEKDKDLVDPRKIPNSSDKRYDRVHSMERLLRRIERYGLIGFTYIKTTQSKYAYYEVSAYHYEPLYRAHSCVSLCRDLQIAFDYFKSRKIEYISIQLGGTIGDVASMRDDISKRMFGDKDSLLHNEF